MPTPMGVMHERSVEWPIYIPILECHYRYVSFCYEMCVNTCAHWVYVYLYTLIEVGTKLMIPWWLGTHETCLALHSVIPNGGRGNSPQQGLSEFLVVDSGFNKLGFEWHVQLWRAYNFACYKLNIKLLIFKRHEMTGHFNPSYYSCTKFSQMVTLSEKNIPMADCFLNCLWIWQQKWQ